jgi:hypothetical protein
MGKVPSGLPAKKGTPSVKSASGKGSKSVKGPKGGGKMPLKGC